MPNVKISNLTKRFGNVTALENVNLEIENGEYLAILGPSGCGKTTLINCITGIVDITEGQITNGLSKYCVISTYECFAKYFLCSLR
jgi:multiple sugar transport system ATP-binding protein